MELSEHKMLAAPVDAVWAALNDMSLIQKCIPGCESLTETAPDIYKIVLAAAIGPVKARFSGTFSVLDIKPGDSYRLKFEGQAGLAGFGSGEAIVSLSDAGNATQLAYQASAQVGGRLAQLGSRLIDASAQRISAKFFDNFERMINGESNLAPETTTPPCVAGS